MPRASQAAGAGKVSALPHDAREAVAADHECRDTWEYGVMQIAGKRDRHHHENPEADQRDVMGHDRQISFGASSPCPDCVKKPSKATLMRS